MLKKQISPKISCNKIQEEIEKKAKLKEKRKRTRMKVSGKSVFELAKIIKRKKEDKI